MTPHEHFPVMREAVAAALLPGPGKLLVDATCGAGGHSEYLLTSCPGLRIVALDKYASAADHARRRLECFAGATVRCGGYERIRELFAEQGIPGMDGILFDLGFSTMQITDPERGFSFRMEGPLDMRFSRETSLTAGEIVNRWDGPRLMEIFEEYGEVPRAKKIVEALIERRRRQPFVSTRDLADFIASRSRFHGRTHPATLFFQGLRIAVNDELNTLRTGLEQACGLLVPGGRMVVISFHSLEDRIVKQFMRNEPSLAVITKKPVVAPLDEVRRNPESRSAKLRIAEKR